MSENGELLKDFQKILPQLKKYFNNLFTPTDDASCDEEFKYFIENETGEFWRNPFNIISVALRERFTFNEVSTMIHDMKRGKAPGWDMIDSEHVLFGGKALCHVLTTIFNQIIDKSF